MNLKKKINLSIFLTFLGVALLFSAILFPYQNHQLVQSYESIVLLLETLVDRDTEEIANEIFDHRLKALKIRIEQIHEIEGVVGISVCDSVGIELINSGEIIEIESSAPRKMIKKNDGFSIIDIKERNGNTLLYAKDIKFLGEDVGSIKILYSLKKIYKDQRYAQLIFGGLIGVLFIGLLVILNFILSRTIVRPIEVLKKSAQKIADGNYETVLEITRNDEIGQLSSNFEAMRIGIKEKVENLEQTENLLRLREKRLLLLTDNMADVISQTDPGSNLAYISPSVKKIFGYEPKDLIGANALNYVHPDDVERISKVAFEARESGKESILINFRWRHVNGEYLWVESSTRLLYGDDGQSNGAIFGTRDISERVRAEEERENIEKQLFQSQKLESIGLLAGGVAHDLNNLLSPILGYTELLLVASDNKFDDSVKGKLEQIQKAGMGARDLVRQLLAFGRKQTLEFSAVNINEIINNYKQFLRRTIPEDIDIQIITSDKVTPILADAGQVEQVIMNLSMNASDAMIDGGKLTIETDIVHLDESYTTNHIGASPGMYIMMSVSDTGIGIDDKTIAQIFDPFYTTKGDDGNGLGLATVYGIVKQHQGNIYVYSEPGKGTTFKVYLPLGNDAVELAEVPGTDKNVVPGVGSETILLVEDSDQVREMTKSILEQYGYTIIALESGDEALSQVEKHNGAVDLLLTDVVLPGMNGREVFESLSKKYAKLKVLYMSGYTNNVIVHRGVLDKGINFIQKPFSVTSLCSKIRGILDNSN